MRPVAHRALVARLQTAWSVGMKIKVIENDGPQEGLLTEYQ